MVHWIWLIAVGAAGIILGAIVAVVLTIGYAALLSPPIGAGKNNSTTESAEKAG